MTSIGFIVLAAGMGTRMKSSAPKVFHKIAGRSMLAHVLSTLNALNPDHLTVVVGPDMDAVAKEAGRIAPDAVIAIQKEQLGTADAVKAALPGLRGFSGTLIVLCADTPLIASATLQDMHRLIEDGADLAVLGFQATDPAGYGRIILDKTGRPAAICEETDASQAEKDIKLCNSGIIAFNGAKLPALISEIGNNNAKGEYYLTDAIQIAALAKMRVSLAQCPEDEVLGINNRGQLALVEAIMQDRLRERAMAGGATLIAPESVFLSFDTRIGQDVIIEPNVTFGPGVNIENGVTIKSFSYLESCLVRECATIGPFARLRAEAVIGEDSSIGNFVEIKKSVLERSVKVKHLAYIGDARVGGAANVGAGVIVCNYDGTAKHHTDIGEGAFIGSNSCLVAPVKIGEDAYIGSGSVISKDVEAEALAVSRARQVSKPGWAARKKQANTKGR